MQCMKCGRDLEPGQVFCDACREVMARYPVKPGVVVQLPNRNQQTVKKQIIRHRPALSAEEQVTALKKTVRWQALSIVLLLAAAIGLGWLSVKLYTEGEKKVLPGQNYYSVTTPGTTEAAEPSAETTELPEYGIAG